MALVAFMLSVPQGKAAAQATEASTAVRQVGETTTPRSTSGAQKLPNGVYLYGQSPRPDQLGSTYLVFQVQDSRVVGAFYMPYSSFDCFNGEFQADRLALNVVDSYERTVHPFSVALDVLPAVASSAGGPSTPVGLEGFHRLETLTANDQRILSTCQADYRSRS